jgi:hypothetical protein
VFEEEEYQENDIGVFRKEEPTDDKKVTGNLARH